MNTVTLDLAPLIQQVLVPLLASVMLTLGAWALNRIAAYFHIQVQNSQREVLENAIMGGIDFVQKNLAPAERVNVSATTAAVVAYVTPKVPGALKSLNITPDHLAEVVQSRLPAA